MNSKQKVILDWPRPKKITDNGNFTAGISAKNTNQDVKSLSGNLGFKLKF